MLTNRVRYNLLGESEFGSLTPDDSSIVVVSDFSPRTGNVSTQKVDTFFLEFDFEQNLELVRIKILTSLLSEVEGLSWRLSYDIPTDRTEARAAYNSPIKESYYYLDLLQYALDEKVSNFTIHAVVVDNPLITSTTNYDVEFQYTYQATSKRYINTYHIREDLVVTDVNYLFEPSYALTETVTVTDTLQTAINSFSDFVNLFDSFGVQGLKIEEGVKVVDTYESDRYGLIADTINLVSRFTNPDTELRDTITIVDSFTFDSVDLFFDNIEPTDTYVNSGTITNTENDTINITTTLTYELIKAQSFEDNIVVSDSWPSTIITPSGAERSYVNCDTLESGVSITNLSDFLLGTVTLPVPVLNDREVLDINRIRQEFLGGRISIKPTQVVGEVVRYKYEFENLTDAKFAEYKTFLQENIGQVIVFRTHENITLSGVVDNLQHDSTEQYEECGWAVGLSIYLYVAKV